MLEERTVIFSSVRLFICPHVIFTVSIVWENLKYGRMINRAEMNSKGRVDDADVDC